jgi:DNA-binding NtrC family response regulator
MKKTTLHILLIDDDNDDIFFTTGYLADIETINTVIDIEVNYRRAVAKVMANPDHVCLVDYFLGAQNGIDLIQECRSAGAQNFFILVTGYMDERLTAQAYNAGAYTVIKKDSLNKDSLENCLLKIIQDKTTGPAVEEGSLTA